jgi:hypothetical protein
MVQPIPLRSTDASQKTSAPAPKPPPLKIAPQPTAEEREFLPP